MDLSTTITDLTFKNPVMPASGCYGFGKEFAKLYDLSLLGGISLKSATLHHRFGNPLPRVAETPDGMLNAIGLQNPGVAAILKDEIPHLEKYDTNIFANVAGASIEEYVEVIKKLNTSNIIDAYELNISCPNVKHGGIALGTSAKLAADVTREAKAVATKPVYVKLSPNVTNIVDIAKAVEEAGADGLILINTLVGMRLDLKTKRPILANGIGGLSGPAIKSVAIRMVYQVYQNVDIPIIGVGGIQSTEDVLEFLLAGASAVQIGMKNFTDPYICPNIIKELPEVLKKYGFNSVKEAIGGAHHHE